MLQCQLNTAARAWQASGGGQPRGSVPSTREGPGVATSTQRATLPNSHPSNPPLTPEKVSQRPPHAIQAQPNPDSSCLS